MSVRRSTGVRIGWRLTPGFWRMSPVVNILLLGVILAAVGLSVERVDWLLQGAMALSLAVAATGLGLALGLGGEFVLGQSAIFATSAYTTAALGSSYHWNFWVAGAGGIVAATIVGVVLSLPGLRIGHFYFGMLGFFMVFLVPNVVQAFEKWTGGSEGLAVLALPTFFGHQMNTRGMFLLGTAVLTVALLLSRNVQVSPLGVHMRRMRDSSVALATSGIAVWRVRFATYALASLLAGAGGAVYSNIQGFLQPGEFGFEMTNLILAGVVIGGSRTLLGPALGVLVLFIVPRVVINVQGYSDIIYGALVLVSVLAFRGGIVAAFRDAARWIDRQRHRSWVEDEVQTIARSPEALADLVWQLRDGSVGAARLVVRGVRKSFGGVRAIDLDDDDEIVVSTGQVHLLLGPNGSGKTTMLNAITGLARPDAGTVTLNGCDLVGMSVPKISRSGISRSFQGPALPDEITPTELFTATLAHAMKVTSWHWLLGDPVASKARRRAERLAGEIVDATGLGAAATETCEKLTSGQRRIVDVVHALISTRSSIVLLDEPAAGLSDPERRQLATTVRALADRGLGFIVVEHDLELALALADDVTVMATGRPVAQGLPDEIKEHAVVKEVLIGGTA